MLADSSRIVKLYTYIASPVLVIRFLFHLIFYYSCRYKELVDEDLAREVYQYKLKFKFCFFAFLWGCRFDPYFRSLFYYRIGPSKASICRMFAEDNSSFTIICEELKSITMYHPFATIINAKRIGENFVVRNSTTIGNIKNNNDLRPIIGDNVELGANVVVIGKITIGNNVTIGAGTIINKDVPDNAIVVGNPMRIVRFKNK